MTFDFIFELMGSAQATT